MIRLLKEPAGQQDANRLFDGERATRAGSFHP